MSHKITKHLMPAEEATRPTPCATDPERWFPDEQKPDPYAVAACWSCYFQAGCARRALSEPAPEHGVWGGYRLAPGPGLARTRAQLEIIAGHEMGPAFSPGPEIIAALEDLAGITLAGTCGTAIADGIATALDSVAAGVVDLDDWREPSAEDLAVAAREERAALALYADELVDDRGQILLPLEGPSTEPSAAPRHARRVASLAGAVAKRAS